ncbi:MAG: rRNA pseudouridine synthase [Ruminococcaceae bacterium]|nr:rRNA pseudouridine synthase [Oscillospiraceae bacterium]
MGEIVRLQKYIAMCGAASRRHAEQFITSGRVKVDGKLVCELGTKVEIGANRVSLDGKELELEKKKYYIMLNKPYGYISAVKDQFERETVVDLVKEELNANLHPVGRLDYDTEGLILLTNDGDFTYHITHPKHNVGKTYIATLKGGITIKHLAALRRGIKVEDYKTSPAEVDLLDSVPGQSRVQITIHEGKNRQVRKMFESLGYTVTALERIAIGKVEIGNLARGRWRHLTSYEISYLMGR